MKRLIILAFAACAALPAVAQQHGPEWGATEEQQSENRAMMMFLRNEVTLKNWGMAAYHLQTLMKNVPQSHPSLYMEGMKMYAERAKAATDPAQQKVLADSLLLMHDKFLEVFGAKYPDMAPSIWNNRVSYIREFYNEDKARVLAAFREGVEKAGDAMPGLIVGYFHELTTRYTAKEIDVEEYLNAYGDLEKRLISIPNTADQQAQLQKLFVDSGAASCETIEQFFGAKIEAAPTDSVLLDRTLAMLNRAKCTGDFYLSVAEKYYKVKPTSETAQILAANFKAKGDNATAARYTQEALSLVSSPEEKARLLLGISSTDLAGNNYSAAYRNARAAADIEAGNTTAHYLMALATAGGAGGCSDATMQRAAYWLAYDRMAEARRLAANDPTANDELKKEIDNNMARFSSAFPSAEDLFLQNLAEGSAYTVNCGWISGRTTVRRRP